MKTIFFSVLCVLATPLYADLEMSDAWARATPPGMPMGAIYGLLTNTGDDQLEVAAISTPVARGAEIHQSIEIDGLMRMREVTPFFVPAGKNVVLQPGGKHIMLMGIQVALKQGESFPLQLRLSNGDIVDVEIMTGSFGQMSVPDR
jgi:copper(I)-binding protein